MTEKEFWQKIKDYGINIYQYQIAVGYKTDEMYYHGIYKKGNQWYSYNVGDRNEIYETPCENEDVAYNVVYNDLLAQMWKHGFNSNYITNDVIQTSKSTICQFLQEKYDLSNAAATNAWQYLAKDFRVLNEFKYFVLNGKFVPTDDCYKPYGYSAQDVSNKLHLNALDSFKYLINLEKEPDKYLAKLK